jgi:hypothetical protein
MGKFSQKMMGKEVGNAGVYAVPHSMDGKKFGAEVAAAAVSVKTNPNTLSSEQVNPRTLAMSVSIGNPGRDDVKTTGIETRGNGAATKGRMARGPMC